ncbi:MAG: ABC transporter ATP-binding protein [Nitrospinota bacterium]
MSGGPALEVTDLDVAFDGDRTLWAVTMAVEEGEVVTLVGPNGAGKSTLLKTVSGLVAPAAGEVRFDGRSLNGLEPTTIVELGIIHVPEGRHLFADMSVIDNLKLGAYALRARPYMYDSLERVFALFPVLKERRRQMVRTLSGGEQQMVAVARGMMLRPRILMLDEPSLGLAPKMVAAIFDTVRAINQEGVTVLLVEQNVRLALSVAHRGVVLENGRIVMQGVAASLLDSAEVKHAYLGL